MQTDLKMDESCLKEMFNDSEESLLLINQDKNVIYLNKKACFLLGNPGSITEIKHLFSSDICILNKENIFNYSPLSEALLIQENMKAEVLFQSGENEYTSFLLRSFKNSGNTIIILSDISTQQRLKENKSLINEYKQRISELEASNKDYFQLQEKSQNLAVRTGLINRISNSIRGSLELDKIIESALKEISNTLGLDKSYFATLNRDDNSFTLKNSWNIKEVKKLDLNNDSGIKQVFNKHKTIISNIMTDPKSGNIQPRLVTPVLYRDKLLGVMVFYHAGSKKSWHEEEINLIEGITSQLASAINQAELFETTLNQKNELENAILKLKETQAQLIQSEKMASLGQLVAGVAHEINTPLGSVNSNNNIIKKCIEKVQEQVKDKDILEILENAVLTNTEAIRRINALVKSLKNFARLDEADYQETDIHEGINSTLALINHETKNKIDIIRDFSTLPPVKCRPNQLNQVFMNILVNACQSIEDSGTITIKTEKLPDSVLITITDTGKGIPAENLDRIFDPGFTTKGVGVGTGLGLSICYQIIEKHRGKITAKSEIDKGTSFIIELPLQAWQGE